MPSSLSYKEKSKIRFDKTKLSLNAGDRDKLSIAYSDIDTTGQNVKWSYDNDDVVSVGSESVENAVPAMVKTSDIPDDKKITKVEILMKQEPIRHFPWILFLRNIQHMEMVIIVSMVWRLSRQTAVILQI